MAFWNRRRRQTQPLDETRAAYDELLLSARGAAEQIAEAKTSAMLQAVSSPGRSTYPASDAASLYSIKGRWDVANRARKITLYQSFLGESWVSACVEAIAGRLISGGWLLKPVDPKHANEATKAGLQELLDWTNEDEDFSQVLHAMATDLLWSGETYLEVTWKRSQTLGRVVPYEIYMVDVISMDYRLGDDRKSISGYVQTTDAGEEIALAPEQILRVWFPDPRNRLKALSPIEKLINPITWDTYLQLFEQKQFEQGNREDIHVNVKSGGEAMAGRLLKWLRERYLGVKNAHLPLVTWGDTEVSQLGNRAAVDVLGRRKFAREEVAAVYKVPPHLLSIIEPGSVGGGGTAAVMEKQFIHTAVDPVRWRLMNPLNFRLAVQGFGIDDWVIDTSYADLRDSREVTDVLVNQVKSGIATPDEARAEFKREPVGGGDRAVFVLAREVVPVEDLPRIHSSQLMQAPGPVAGPGQGTPGGAPSGAGGDGADQQAHARQTRDQRPEVQDSAGRLGGLREQAPDGIAARARPPAGARERTRAAYERWAAEHGATL